MNTDLFLYITAILAACVFTVVFAAPLGKIVKVAVNSAIGGAFIILFNFISQLFGFFIGVNALTAAVVGLLGAPGFVMLLMLRLILV